MRQRMIIWQGPSVFDGSPLVVLCTYDTDPNVSSSQNAKTGDLMQTYILRDDMAPSEALRLGLDTAICRDCPHRSVMSGGSGACYVNVPQSVDSTYFAYKRDGHRVTKAGNPTSRGDSVPFDVKVFRGRRVRFGTYGDPSAVPFEVWEAILAVADNWTAYTHQWAADDIDPRFSQFCMASVDRSGDEIAARARGYRSYIVREYGAPKPVGAVQCPSSVEAGYKTVCASCLQCSGTGRGRKSDISIMAHGATKKRFMSLPLTVVK